MSKIACDYCDISIFASDFDKGRAVVILKRTYCKKYLERAVRQKTINPNHTGKHAADTPR